MSIISRLAFLAVLPALITLSGCDSESNNSPQLSDPGNTIAARTLTVRNSGSVNNNSFKRSEIIDGGAGAISGDWAVSGSSIYRRIGDSWSQLQSIERNGDAAFENNQLFAIDNGNINIYEFNGSAWNVSNTISVSSTDSLRNFSIDNNQLAVSGNEAVYVFKQSGSDWQRELLLQVGTDLPLSITEQNGATNNARDVAIDGEWLVIGDPEGNSSGRGLSTSRLNQESGSVFLYRQSGGTWSLQSRIRSSSTDTELPYNFGGSVDIKDNTLIVSERNSITSERATASLYQWNGSSWELSLSQTLNGFTRAIYPQVALSTNKAVFGVSTGPFLFVKENGNWQVADVSASYIEGPSKTLKQTPPGYLTYTIFDGFNWSPYSIYLTDDQLIVDNPDLDINSCVGTLVLGFSRCDQSPPLEGPTEIFDFNISSNTPAGSVATVQNVNQWHFDSDTRGYIATYECAIADSDPAELLIDFNYTGPGNSLLGYMLTFVGDIREGNIGPDNGYAIRVDNPYVSAGQSIQFEVVVQDATFQRHDWDIRCLTQSQPQAPQPPTPDGSTNAIGVNEWEFPNNGYIATFECNISSNNIANVEIDFNYTGPGNGLLGWMLTYIGNIEEGNIASDGGYAIRTVGDVHALSSGQAIQFELLVENAAYDSSHFNVQCSS